MNWSKKWEGCNCMGASFGEGQHSDFIALIYTQNCFSRVTADLHWIYHIQSLVYTHCRSILTLLSISMRGVFFFLDVNECSYVEFNTCPEKNTCVNLEGYYSCNPQHEHADVNPHQLTPRKEGKKRRSHLGKYWEHFCRTLWSIAGATWKAKISGAHSASSPPVGSRCHISQLEMQCIYFTVSGGFSYPTLSCPYSPAKPSGFRPWLLLRASRSVSVHLPSLLGNTISDAICTWTLLPILTAWLQLGLSGCIIPPWIIQGPLLEADGVWQWVKEYFAVPVQQNIEACTYSPQTSMGLLIGLKIMR